jgi:hypothetical protein
MTGAANLFNPRLILRLRGFVANNILIIKILDDKYKSANGTGERPMGTTTPFLTGLASALALIGIGGGLYEILVVDPFWPKRQDLIQPSRGGIDRKRFWISAHVAFELTLLGAFVMSWSAPEIRTWLLVALCSHAIMRIWSAFDFIPKALAFERVSAESFSESDAGSWTRRSRLRLPLDIVTSLATILAFVAAVRLS